MMPLVTQLILLKRTRSEWLFSQIITTNPLYTAVITPVSQQPHTCSTLTHHAMYEDHCIDQLRQMVQCHGDITPMPTKWHKGLRHNYIDVDRVHTCRNFEEIRSFTTARYNGTSRVGEVARPASKP